KERDMSRYVRVVNDTEENPTTGQYGADENSHDSHLERWGQIVLGNILDEIDEGISAMVVITERLSMTRSFQVQEDLVGDLECAAFATAWKMADALSEASTCRNPLPFGAGTVLGCAVEQYV